ncbi:hypothetical protein QYE76_032879 [Lolium multiflorum]|uniref:Double-strand break repair protein n=1 Tax=Lolium multiflorum TaxID=4521 RepID=A0AAD8QW16_LOLMU|nr:hypothetical protein QYE76_032879 [Lolium multiflorum]
MDAIDEARVGVYSESGGIPREAAAVVRRGGESSSTLRILVATDCHLGYLEKDELRRSDSFDTFEEIFSLAEQHKVDFVLLGGNLFHENNPSRSTLVKTIEILRRCCLGDRPVQFQVVSDQATSLQNLFGRVNHEDPNINISLPVFTIHGDHDDPTGVDNMSAIDVLASAGFVNYFGKVDLGSSDVDEISLHPILIKKAATSVALYGLGNVRETRLREMFQTPGAIKWINHESPEDMPLSNWFNIMILHQNRRTASPDNGITEYFLPHSLDLVIWGHEHESIADPQEVPGMGFHITQPGSTITTSLTSAEATQKHGMKYRPTKIPLKTVRPFEYAEVENLIEKNNRKTGSGLEPKLPLVRIKVDYSGFSTINPHRFGQKYVGKVANPQDVIVFSRSAKRRQNTQVDADGSEQIYPTDLDQCTVEDLVAESNVKTQILQVNDLQTALHVFVKKDDNMAFHSCLQKNTEDAKKKLTDGSSEFKSGDKEKLALELDRCMQASAKQETGSTPSSQNLPASMALSAFEELKCSSDHVDQDTHNDSDELIEISSEDEQRHQLPRPVKRTALAMVGGPASSSSSSCSRRKTDLTSYRRIPPAKEEEDDRAKKRRSPHVRDSLCLTSCPFPLLLVTRET